MLATLLSLTYSSREKTHASGIEYRHEKKQEIYLVKIKKKYLLSISILKGVVQERSRKKKRSKASKTLKTINSVTIQS